MDKLVIRESDIELYIGYLINNSNDFRIQDLGLMTEKFRSFFKPNCEIMSAEEYTQLSGQEVKGPTKVYVISSILLSKYVDLCSLEIMRLMLKQAREKRMIDYVMSQNGEITVIPIGKNKDNLIKSFNNFLNGIKDSGEPTITNVEEKEDKEKVDDHKRNTDETDSGGKDDPEQSGDSEEGNTPPKV